MRSDLIIYGVVGAMLFMRHKSKASIGKIEDVGKYPPFGRIDRYWKNSLQRYDLVGRDLDLPYKNILAENFVKRFGLAGVEFGNWMSQRDRASHLSACAQSFADLAKVLGINQIEIGLNHRLSMAFGARGQSGARAHYEPWHIVINLTKHKGAGSLAHEYGHAIDFVSGSIPYSSRSPLLHEHLTDFRNRVVGRYLKSPEEQIARLFHRFVYDKLQDKGIPNEYLARFEKENIPSSREAENAIPELRKLIREVF